MEIPYAELKQQLQIHATVIYDANKQLTVKKDFIKKQKHGHSGGKTLFYTSNGKTKVISYVEEVKKLQVDMTNALFKLGYQHKESNSNALNVLIGLGAYCYLKEQGYAQSTIAFILKKNRTTLYNTEKVMHSYMDEPIYKVVIDETVRQLTKRIARPIIWDDDRKERLREMYPSKTNKEIAMYLNTTVGNIEFVAHKLQLRKDKKHITKVRRSNVNKRFYKEVK